MHPKGGARGDEDTDTTRHRGSQRQPETARDSQIHVDLKCKGTWKDIDGEGLRGDRKATRQRF